MALGLLPSVPPKVLPKGKHCKVNMRLRHRPAPRAKDRRAACAQLRWRPPCMGEGADGLWEVPYAMSRTTFIASSTRSTG